MDISLPLDHHLHSRCRFAYISTKSNVSSLWLKREKKQYNTFYAVKFSSIDQVLLARPPRPVPKTETKKNFPEYTQVGNSGSICGQVEKLVLHKKYREALELFEILECEVGFELDSSTYDALISACIGLKSVRGVKRVFGWILDSGFELDLYMKNRVLLMHVKCGMMIDARMLFDDLPERNIVSWNIIISGLVESGDYLGAFRLFLEMWEEFDNLGSRTFAIMIRASAGLELISPGMQLHSCALKLGLCDNVYVSCALIDMYSKCGRIDDGRIVFDMMHEKSTVGWNSIIAGYALHGYSEEALNLYYAMQNSGVKMDHFTFSIIIKIYTRLASLEHGKQSHAGLVRHGFGLDMVANTALVDFYCKWGRIEDARNIFNNMPQKNVLSWNALIAGYGNHGRGIEAIELFDHMVSAGMVPNHVTFLAVLGACSYSGLSDRGWDLFKSMGRDYNVKPRAMHYACMIELLGREGLLDEAFALIRDAPFKPTVNMWAALLTACRVHTNFSLGKLAAEKLYGMEPEKLSNYIILLNIYNCSGKLEEAAAVVHTLKRKGLRILPACTWIEIKKKSHIFYSGDKGHVQTKEIYEMLDELTLELLAHDYVMDESSLLPDVEEHEERLRHFHSEKLAICFGLINTPDSTALQLVQSHRICNDCHNWTKMVSSVTKRRITVRDGSRFHHFGNGNCSCGDYW
ncbi:hypothetical protein Leryth_008489 [Lithospermum erythrorhizon]|nr:hypothetical protein Leryth_008489 [Lithospermum erythrorhizon]